MSTDPAARAVVFDLDDTLLDQSSAADAAVIAWASELGLEHADVAHTWSRISSRHYTRYQSREITFEDQRRERVREFLGRSFTDDEASRTFRGYLDRYESGWRLFPDAIPAARRARAAGRPVVILTNGDRTQQLRKLDRFALSGEIDALVCSSELPFGKPHASAFLAATRELGFSEVDSLMVGDSVANDYQGAVDFGMRAILIDRAGEHLHRAIASVASLDDIAF